MPDVGAEMGDGEYNALRSERLSGTGGGEQKNDYKKEKPAHSGIIVRKAS